MKEHKKTSKHIVINIFLMLASIILTACSPQNMTESEIEADFTGTIRNILPIEESLDHFEIINRETDKDNQTDTIWCRAESHDDDTAYVRFYEIKYQLVDKEWVLESTTPYRESEWAKVPTMGVKDSLIAELITADVISSYLGNVIKIDGEEWHIGESGYELYISDEMINFLLEMLIGFDIGYESVSSIRVSNATVGNTEIINRDTQLALNSDKITMTVELMHDVLMAKGEMQFDFIYEDGWVLDNAHVTKHFASSQRPGTEFELTEEEALSAIAKHAINNPVEFGEQYLNKQNISISSNEISDFRIKNEVLTHLNTVQVYEGNFILSKDLVDFDISTTLIYQYDPAGGWGVREVAFSSPEIKTVHTDRFIGDWVGTYGVWGIDYSYNGNYSMILEITSIGNDGAVIAYVHDRSANPYSVEMTGFLDMNNLTISIKSHGNNHPMFSKMRSRITSQYDGGMMGVLEIETSTLSSWAPRNTGIKDGCYYHEFEATKTE